MCSGEIIGLYNFILLFFCIMLKKKLIAAVVSVATIASVGVFVLQSNQATAGSAWASCASTGWWFPDWIVTPHGASVYVKKSNGDREKVSNSQVNKVYSNEPQGISFDYDWPFKSCPTLLFK